MSTTTPITITTTSTNNDTGNTTTEEQTEFQISLTNFNNKKIQIIKTIHTITNLKLKKTKELIDNTPNILKKNTSKNKTKELKKQIEKTDNNIEIK